MAYTDRPEDIYNRLARMEREMADLRRRVGIQSAIIRKGTLALKEDARFEIIDADDDLVARMGSLGFKYDDGRSQQGLEFRYEDGAPAFTIWRPTAHTSADRQYTAIWNGSRIVVSTDADTGEGLGRPWLDIPFQRADTPTATPPWPGMFNTASGSFVNAYEAHTSRQHPWLAVRVYITNNGATGEWQLTVNGVLLDTFSSPAPSISDRLYRINDTIAPLHGPAQINLAFRRTAGAGTVWGNAWAWWRQS